MNALRVLATVLALIIGCGGAAVALTNLPSLQAFESKPVPDHVWINIVMGVLLPASFAFGAATALLLLVRIDRRLDQLK